MIAANSGTYDGLLDWLRQYGGAEVQAALAARDAGTASVAPPAPPAEPAAETPADPAVAASPAAEAAWTPSAPAGVFPPGVRWQEPSRSVPITWLNHDLRYTLSLVAVGLAGLFQIIIVPALVGAIQRAVYWNYSGIGTELLFTFLAFLVGALPLLLVGAGIFVLPSQRRNTMLALGIVGIPLVLFVLQTLFIVGYQSSGNGVFSALAVILYFAGLLAYPAVIAGWLIARMRPVITFALLPAALLAILFGFYGQAWPGTASGAVFFGSGFGPLGVLLALLAVGTLVGIAWLARLIAQRKDLGPTPPAYGTPAAGTPAYGTPAYATPAYAATGVVAPAPGAAAPAYAAPGYAAPGYGAPGYPVMPVARTNTMAILALVFGIGGGWLGILFGHMALSQIRRTGEQGRGLALAGLICGYVGAGFWLIVIIVSIAVNASLRYY